MFSKCLALLALAIAPALAQPLSQIFAQPLPPPNAAGISFGGFEFHEEHSQMPFWTAVVGPRPMGYFTAGQITGPSFQGIELWLVLVSEKPIGGTVGSVVDHLGLSVKNLPDTLSRVKAAGFVIQPGADPTQAFISGPDGLKIEVKEDPVAAQSVQWDHIDFATADPDAMRAWYEQVFGALEDNSGPLPAADLPGIRLVFERAEGVTSPTIGRVMDHIQFVVTNLEQFQQRAEAQGVHFNPQPRIVPPTKPTSAGLTDPWGTSITLREIPKR